jgi:hypothetical protein
VLLVERLNSVPPWDVSGGVDTPSVTDVGSVTGENRFEVRGVLVLASRPGYALVVWDLVLEGTPGDASYNGPRDGCSNEGPVYCCSVASLILSSRF